MFKWENWFLIFAALIVQELYNFIKPRAKSYFENRKLASNEVKMKFALDQYKIIKYYTTHHTEMGVETLRLLADALRRVTILITALGFYVISTVKGTSTLFWGNFVIMYFFVVLAYIGRVDGLYDNVTNFKSYKDKTIKQLTKLGGNLEDLDKEDNEEIKPD